MELRNAVALYGGVVTVLIFAIFGYYIGIPIYQSITEEPTRISDCEVYNRTNEGHRNVMESAPKYQYSELSNDAKQVFNDSIGPGPANRRTVNRSFMDRYRNDTSVHPYAFILHRTNESYLCVFHHPDGAV